MATPPSPANLSTETINPPPSTTQSSTTTTDESSIAQTLSIETLSDEPQPSDQVKRKREEEQPEGAAIPLWKTSLCSYYRRNDGSCSHGDTCRYAHGEAELRPRPDNTWDPTSERAKKLLKLESEKERDAEVLDARQDVLMTDNVGDDGDGSSLDPGLSKCLVHLPRSWTSDQLKRFLGDQGVIYKTAKKKKGMTVGFASFETTDEVKNAVEILDGKSIGNKRIKVADVLPRSFERKTQPAFSFTQSTKLTSVAGLANEDSNGSVRLDGQENVETDEKNDSSANSLVSQSRSVRDAVTPLAHMPYAEQLEHKKSSLVQILKKLPRNARKACPEAVALPEWILKSRDIGGLPCKLEGIIESPLVNGYRNKCEFSVGYSIQGKPTVGFMLGNFREGVTAVEEPTNCPNVSKIACKFASIFQEVLGFSSLPIWNRLNNTGFWRQLTVREGRSHSDGCETPEANISELMLMVQICSVGFDDELVKSELQRLAQAFVDEANANTPPLPLTSLVVQDHKGISNAAPADAPLHPLSITKTDGALNQDAMDGDNNMRIHDYIGNLCFSISPTAFFQVNTLAAEKLYSLAGDWAGLGPDTLLFDVCCGTGTIGLTLAHRVGMVVGIEMNASAVSDAQRNAEINGITNCRFVCGKAEDVIGSILKEYSSVPNKQEGNSHVSETNGKGDIDDQDNDVSVDKLNADGLDDGTGEVKSVSGSAEHRVEELDKSEKKNQITHTPELQYKNIVAIVDPPRAGLHPVVIKALRTHPRLKRLVYISCNPESLVANAIELCTPSADKTEKVNGHNNNRGWRNMSSAGLARRRTKSMPDSEPFQPVKAMAVDLFPHTPHCELVMLLER